MIIAIDGPVGSGKSTVARHLAERLEFLYVDTGAMYRAITLKAMRLDIDLKDEKALTELAQNTDIYFKRDSDKFLMTILDGEDVHREIRTPELTKNIAYIAKVRGVREIMVEMQRRIGKGDVKGAVLEGRDIGTVVFPDADKKFYLDAGIHERTKRRHKELIESGQDVSLEDIQKDIEIRDTNDLQRDIAPLRKAEDAIYLDTTNLSIRDVVDRLVSLCK